jgi:hypothetical protein
MGIPKLAIDYGARTLGGISWGEREAWTIQRACEIELAPRSLNQGFLEIPQTVLEQCTRVSLQFDPTFGTGVDVFNALVRQIDRNDQNYKS